MAILKSKVRKEKIDRARGNFQVLLVAFYGTIVVILA